MKIDPGMHARPDLAFKGLLAMFACMTKKNAYAWRQLNSTTAAAFESIVGESDHSFGEGLGTRITVMIEFSDYACLGCPNRKTERFRFGVVVDHVHQVLDIRSSADTYDLFARLFKAAYDSAKKADPESVAWRTKHLDWRDILRRKWKINQAEIRKIAEESLANEKRDFVRKLEAKTRDVRHSYEHEGFTITGKTKDKTA